MTREKKVAGTIQIPQASWIGKPSQVSLSCLVQRSELWFPLAGFYRESENSVTAKPFSNKPNDVITSMEHSLLVPPLCYMFIIVLASVKCVSSSHMKSFSISMTFKWCHKGQDSIVLIYQFILSVLHMHTHFWTFRDCHWLSPSFCSQIQNHDPSPPCSDIPSPAEVPATLVQFGSFRTVQIVLYLIIFRTLLILNSKKVYSQNTQSE